MKLLRLLHRILHPARRRSGSLRRVESALVTCHPALERRLLLSATGSEIGADRTPVSENTTHFNRSESTELTESGFAFDDRQQPSEPAIQLVEEDISRESFPVDHFFPSRPTNSPPVPVGAAGSNAAAITAADTLAEIASGSLPSNLNGTAGLPGSLVLVQTDRSQNSLASTTVATDLSADTSNTAKPTQSLASTSEANPQSEQVRVSTSPTRHWLQRREGFSAAPALPDSDLTASHKRDDVTSSHQGTHPQRFGRATKLEVRSRPASPPVTSASNNLSIQSEVDFRRSHAGSDPSAVSAVPELRRFINLFAALPSANIGEEETWRLREWVVEQLESLEHPNATATSDEYVIQRAYADEPRQSSSHTIDNHQLKHAFSRIDFSGTPLILLTVLSEDPPEPPEVVGIWQHLEFECNPRGPPLSDHLPASEFSRLTGSGIQLQRLRYSIAPRGPSAISIKPIGNFFQIPHEAEGSLSHCGVIGGVDFKESRAARIV